MTLDDVQRNTIYETRCGNKKEPLYVVDVIPTGVICTNLNTKREVFIKKEQLSRMGSAITSMSEWRLHNGEARA